MLIDFLQRRLTEDMGVWNTAVCQSVAFAGADQAQRIGEAGLIGNCKA